jgi:hypothetical protein
VLSSSGTKYSCYPDAGYLDTLRMLSLILMKLGLYHIYIVYDKLKRM